MIMNTPKDCFIFYPHLGKTKSHPQLTPLNKFICSHIGPIALSLGTWDGIKMMEVGDFPFAHGSKYVVYDTLLDPPRLLASFIATVQQTNDFTIIQALLND